MAWDPFLAKQSLSEVVERVSNTPPTPIELTYTRTTAPTSTANGLGKLTVVGGISVQRKILEFMTPAVYIESSDIWESNDKPEVTGRRIPVIINQNLNPLFPISTYYSACLLSTGLYSMFLEVTYGEPDAAPNFKRFLIKDITTPTGNLVTPSACYMNVFLPKTGSASGGGVVS